MEVIQCFQEYLARLAQPDSRAIFLSVSLVIATCGFGPIGLYLTSKRTDTDSKRRIDEMVAKVIALLGSEQATARQGGIYILGDVAKQHTRYVKQVLQITSSYIRDKNRTAIKEANEKANVGALTMDAILAQETMTKLQTQKIIKCVKAYNTGVDVEVAILILKQVRHYRNKKISKKDKFDFDLSNTLISNADFGGLNLSNVNLTNSFFVGCDFTGVNMSYASINGTVFQDCLFAADDKAETADKNTITTGMFVADAKFFDKNSSTTTLTEEQIKAMASIGTEKHKQYPVLPNNLEWEKVRSNA